MKRKAICVFKVFDVWLEVFVEGDNNLDQKNYRVEVLNVHKERAKAYKAAKLLSFVLSRSKEEIEKIENELNKLMEVKKSG